MAARAAIVESGAVAILGGVLGASAGAIAGRLSGDSTSLAVLGALTGSLNGAVSGARGIYDWRSPAGALAALLDATWALPMTAAGVVANGVGLATPGRSGYDETLSRRQNRHVHRGGFVPRRGFAITLGNVVNGAGDVDRPRRRRLVTDHEDVHIWQARWFGPLYPVLYGGWMVGGAVVGPFLWAVRGRREPLWKVVETCSYYLNPLEWWAYSRDDHWPPSGKVPGIGWARPGPMPLAAATSLRFGRAGRATPR